MQVPSVKLSENVQMPIIGFGTWQASESEIEKAVDIALECNYRHIDTAIVYENEAAVGRILNKWLSSKRVQRSELFIVAKLPPGGNRPSTVEKYLRKSLHNLQLDYVDLYLIHVPFTFKDVEGDFHPKDEDGSLIIETNTDHVQIWKEMERMVDLTLTRCIGVSNFNEQQIKRIISNSRIIPAAIQIELHVYFQQNELVSFCKSLNIAVIAYSPLGSSGLGQLLVKLGLREKPVELLEDSTVKEIAKKHRKTTAQVLLRYTIQRGIAVIPKSINKSRIQENFAIFDFELDCDDLENLQKLNKGSQARICDFNFFKGIKNHPEFPW